MAFLSTAEIGQFRDTGCLVCPDAVTAAQLAAMRADLAGWIEESRAHAGPYGKTFDNRPRFDVEPGHNAEKPTLRRVASPTEISETYLDVMQNGRMLDMLADLIGPDLRFHHSKINSKLPGSGTIVDWHQDFNYDPHSNDDVVTSLLFLDEVTPENGPLMTAPGSHTGPLHSLWHDGIFTGAMGKQASAAFEKTAVRHTGPAGSVCFMHARVAHASRANASTGPRSLFISCVAAADAIPLAANHLPSVHMGMLLRGKEPGRVRSIAFEMEISEVPKGASFFTQQNAANSG